MLFRYVGDPVNPSSGSASVAVRNLTRITGPDKSLMMYDPPMRGVYERGREETAMGTIGAVFQPELISGPRRGRCDASRSEAHVDDES